MDNIEQEIQAKGLTAPRVTPADIESRVAEEYYFTAAEGVIGAQIAKHAFEAYPVVSYSAELLRQTICVLVLQNGFVVSGESACTELANFDAELGRKIARANAIAKIWPLEGYLLKQRLALPPIEHHPV